MNVVISNVFGSYNRGDALLVEGVYDAVLHVYGSDVEVSGIAHFPKLEEAHIPAVEWSSPPGRSYSESRTVKRLMNVWRLGNAMIYCLFRAPKSWPEWLLPYSQRQSIRALKNADLVVSCAGGFLLDVNPSILGNIFQLAVASFFNVKFILAPQTIGPVRRRLIRRLLSHYLNRADLVCVREEFSREFVLDVLGVPQDKVVRTTDLALEGIKPPDREAGVQLMSEIGINGHFIGVTIVDWAFPSSFNPEEDKRTYILKMAELFRSLHSKTGLDIVVFNQVSSDLNCANEIASLTGDFITVDHRDCSTRDMLNMISLSQLFIGSRFHSCVFALLAVVPTISISYTYKSTGIMNDLQLSDSVFDIVDFDTQALLNRAIEILNTRSQECIRVLTGLDFIQFPKFREVLQTSRDH
jgi:colanic acid/amylovoran biosynthesis protein